MNKRNIVVLFGGCSSEYSVSLESASCVIRHIDREKFNPILVGITKAGDWYRFTGDTEKISSDTWFNVDDCVPAALSPNRGMHELLVFHGEKIERIAIEAVFPVLHGRNGEDGTIQGMCELAGIPVVGCGTLASALGMDKDRAHKLAFLAGVRVPQSFVLEHVDETASVQQRAEIIGYPLFVKPVKAGSSHGITKVTDRSQLTDAIATAFRYDNQVIVEECIPGCEVGCAVLGNRELVISEIDEIELADGFFNFTEKYNLITSKIHVPARISKEQSDRLKRTAEIIYRALGCQGFARVDMFLMPSGEIVFNEVNTIPGLTPHSRFPSMLKTVDVSFGGFVAQAIELALQRNDNNVCETRQPSVLV